MAYIVLNNQALDPEFPAGEQRFNGVGFFHLPDIKMETYGLIVGTEKINGDRLPKLIQEQAFSEIEGTGIQEIELDTRILLMPFRDYERKYLHDEKFREICDVLWTSEVGFIIGNKRTASDVGIVRIVNQDGSPHRKWR